MILISLCPFDYKKIFGLVATMICLSSVTGFADALLLSVPSTPYDRQMTRIQPVLFSQSAVKNSNVSLAVVNHWMQDLRGIPYGFSAEWKTPSEVANGAVADCKGKAVALYQRMHAGGASNVRLVIGKRSWTSSKTHAWLEWSTAGSNYVLDPTINWSACQAQKVGARSYIPMYAFSGTEKFRAAPSSLYANN